MPNPKPVQSEGFKANQYAAPDMQGPPAAKRINVLFEQDVYDVLETLGKQKQAAIRRYVRAGLQQEGLL